jgi:putative MFS transporter
VSVLAPTKADRNDGLDVIRNPVQAGARLDRLPIFSFHREIVWLLGFVFFFELGDINTFSFAAPAILKTWHLPIAVIGYTISATFIGMFIGATTGGWLSDQIGRKKALIFATVWYSGFSLMNAAVWEPIGLFLTRLMTGVGLSAMTVVGVTYVSEMFPAKKRGAYQGWISTIGIAGIPVTAFVARICIPSISWGWRLVFIWGAFAIFFPLLAVRLEESPRWYERRGRQKEAAAVLERLETRARSEVGNLPPIDRSSRTDMDSGRYSELLRPPYLSRTLMHIFLWVCQTLGFYGFMSWAPTLLVAHGFSISNSLTWESEMQLGAVPGAFLAALISDHWERKWWIAITAMLIATFGLLYGLTFHATSIVILGFLVAMLIQAFAPLLYAYTPECYPTAVRNSAVGLSYGAGRLSNAFGPLVVAFLFNHYGYTSVFVFIAGAWVMVGAVAGLFGPRTRGRTLV